MKIKDIMTKNPITISPDFSVGHTLDIFQKNQVRALPVISNNKIVGVVTAQDIYKKSTNRQEKISDIMSKTPVTISPDEELIKAIELIKKTNIFEIIVAKYNKLVGILSITDIIKKVQYKK